MAYIDCLVDTNPMAHKIGSVADNVQRTTTAVVGMQAAVVLAEQRAADMVCDNVNKGFFTLIHSQISQKIAKLQSEVDSHLIQLNQQSKQLGNVRNHMEKNYNMITANYIKLFNGLNQNLKTRIFELDKPVMEFAVTDTSRLQNRTKALPAANAITQVEAMGTSQRIIASNVRYKGMNVINSMSDFLTDMAKQREIAQRILIERNAESKECSISVPVLINEQVLDKFGNRTTEISLNTSELSQEALQQINNGVRAALNSMEWHTPAESNVEVNNEFYRFLSNSNASPRVKETITRLFAKAQYETI